MVERIIPVGEIREVHATHCDWYDARHYTVNNHQDREYKKARIGYWTDTESFSETLDRLKKKKVIENTSNHAIYIDESNDTVVVNESFLFDSGLFGYEIKKRISLPHTIKLKHGWHKVTYPTAESIPLSLEEIRDRAGFHMYREDGYVSEKPYARIVTKKGDQYVDFNSDKELNDYKRIGSFVC